jgi:hypothetical protein
VRGFIFGKLAGLCVVEWGMDENLAKASLVIFIIAVFGFLGTYLPYMNFTQHECGKNINSALCVETYSAYMHNTFNL